MKISYLKLGASAGLPIAFFHGFPGSMQESRAFQNIGQDYQIWSFDRPGYGETDWRWSSQIEQYLEQIYTLMGQPNRMAVIGISGGGPFATEFAKIHQSKVTSLTLICALAGLKDTRVVESFTPIVSRLIKLYKIFPEQIKIKIFSIAKKARGQSPERFLKNLKRRLPVIDQLALDNPIASQIMGETFLWAQKQNLKGCVSDLNFYLNWQPPQNLDQAFPIRAYHGNQDTIVNITNLDIYLEIWPAAKFEKSNDGHFSLPINKLNHIFKIFESEN